LLRPAERRRLRRRPGPARPGAPARRPPRRPRMRAPPAPAAPWALPLLLHPPPPRNRPAAVAPRLGLQLPAGVGAPVPPAPGLPRLHGEGRLFRSRLGGPGGRRRLPLPGRCSRSARQGGRMTRILDGKPIAAALRAEVAA